MRWKICNEARSTELAVNIPYLTSASGKFFLLKTPTTYGEFFPPLFVKTTDFQFVFILNRGVQLPYLESMV